jgi:hypothetical protein
VCIGVKCFSFYQFFSCIIYTNVTNFNSSSPFLTYIQNNYSEDPILDFNIDDFDLQDLPEIKEKR